MLCCFEIINTNWGNGLKLFEKKLLKMFVRGTIWHLVCQLRCTSGCPLSGILPNGLQYMCTLFEINNILLAAEQQKWSTQFNISLLLRRRKFCRLPRKGDKIWLLVTALDLSDLQGQLKVVCFQLQAGDVSPWRNIKESFLIAQITLILIYLEQLQLYCWWLQCNTPMYPSCSNGSLHILT